jgi:hypothetical protein
LEQYCDANDVSGVEGLISSFGQAAVVTAKNRDGETGLYQAARNGATDVVRLLLEHGADPNAKTDYQETPVYWAAYNDHSAVFAVLVEAGADVDDPPGFALAQAIIHSKINSARMLLRCGASLGKAIEWGYRRFRRWIAGPGEHRGVRREVSKGVVRRTLSARIVGGQPCGQPPLRGATPVGGHP